MNLNSIVRESDLEIFRTELQGELPARIFDSHVHFFRKGDMAAGTPPDKIPCLDRFGGEFTPADFRAICRTILPGIDVAVCGFGFVDPAIRRSVSCGFGADGVTDFGLRLLSPLDPVDELDRDVKKHRLAGFKPYSTLAALKTGGPVELRDFFSPEQLAYIEANGLVCVVHIPGRDRLNSASTRAQMVELCRKCPHAHFIFAHIGRAYFLRGVTGMLDELASCPNAYLDTAMVNHPDVLRYTFGHFPKERILFGSDAPLAFLHGKSVEINHQYAYVTDDEKLTEGTVIYDSARRLNYTFFLYEQFRAILSCGLSGADRENFFYRNAFNLYRSTMERRGVK